MNRILQDILRKKSPSILITRIDHIGDTLLYTPALAALRNHFSDAKIIAISNPLTHDVLLGNPYLNEIILDDTSKTGSKKSRADFYQKIKSMKFDIIINFSAAVRDFLEICRYGGKYCIAPVYSNMVVSRIISAFTIHEGVLCHDDPGKYSNNPSGYPLLHEVEQNLKVVSRLGAKIIDSPLLLPLFPEDEDFAENLLRKDLGIPPNKKIIAVQISDRWFWEGYREEGLSLLISEVSKRFPNCQIICFSYPGVQDIERKVIEIIQENQGLSVQFISSLPLKKYAATLKRCNLLITMHSGATHISAAVGLPSVVIFNPDYFEYFSYRERPWKVQFRAVKKTHNEKAFRKLGKTERENALKTNVEIVIGKSLDILGHS